MGSPDETWAVVIIERVRPDLKLVDQLARLQLEARRLGCSIRLVDPPDDLCRLLELVGLAEVVPGEGEATS